MDKGDVMVVFIKDYSNRKAGDEGIFSEDIAGMLVEQKVAKIKPEEEEKPKAKPQGQQKK